ncbi:MAG: hypothetical protein V4511_02200 [Bacteroidota bacterium]
MNIYIILGTIIVAVGSLIIYFGSNRDSQSSQNEITEKLNETQKKIDNLKLTSIDTQKVNQIENEFHEWANDFVQNKDKKKIFIEKKHLENKESRIGLNEQYRPCFLLFLETTKNIINAYNAKTGEKFSYTINSLPMNIFDSNAEQYNAKITFKADVIWKIEIRPAGIFSDNIMASFQISITNEDGSEKDRFALMPHEGKVIVVKLKNTRFKFDDIPSEFLLDDITYKNIAKKFIESQLLQL